MGQGYQRTGKTGKQEKIKTAFKESLKAGCKKQGVLFSPPEI